ncbi:MAG: hypothetical protein MHM6MM_008702 [Cercozoa sp. M6MM]
MDLSPCPDRIVDDLGSAFAMGCIGGSVMHTVRTWRDAPRRSRLKHVLQNVSQRAPTIGSGFAMWGGLYAVWQCALSKFRRKDDKINSVLAGGLTSFVLAIGTGNSVRQGLFGLVFIGIIEGLSVLASDYFQKQQAQQQQQELGAFQESLQTPGAPGTAAPVPEPIFDDTEADAWEDEMGMGTDDEWSYGEIEESQWDDAYDVIE